MSAITDAELETIADAAKKAHADFVGGTIGTRDFIKRMIEAGTSIPLTSLLLRNAECAKAAREGGHE